MKENVSANKSLGSAIKMIGFCLEIVKGLTRIVKTTKASPGK